MSLSGWVSFGKHCSSISSAWPWPPQSSTRTRSNMLVVVNTGLLSTVGSRNGAHGSTTIILRELPNTLRWIRLLVEDVPQTMRKPCCAKSPNLASVACSEASPNLRGICCNPSTMGIIVFVSNSNLSHHWRQAGGGYLPVTVGSRFCGMCKGLSYFHSRAVTAFGIRLLSTGQHNLSGCLLFPNWCGTQWDPKVDQLARRLYPFQDKTRWNICTQYSVAQQRFVISPFQHRTRKDTMGWSSCPSFPSCSFDIDVRFANAVCR